MKQTVLLVKTSSLGDVLHLLPALSDARRQLPDMVFHWVVEEHFAEVATWHPSVEKVIPIALRRWRKQPLRSLGSGEWLRFIKTLRAEPYTWIMDAQGLVKSAMIARLARGWRFGLDRHSAREPLAAWFYQTPLSMTRKRHALDRLRHLFSKAFQYPLPQSPPDYGLEARFGMRRVVGASTKQVGLIQATDGYWVFLHGTTWPSKHWPEAYWLALAKLCAPHGQIFLPWGNAQEEARAQRISHVAPSRVFPAGKTNLTQLATLLAGAKAVVAVDTGPSHLAAALGTPVIGLYGPTDPQRIGTVGKGQWHLQGECDLVHACPSPLCLKRACPLEKRSSSLHPPCLHAITPERVWKVLRELP